MQRILLTLVLLAVPSLSAGQDQSAELRKLLPKVASPELQEVLDDPDLFLYTEDTMPRAHQDYDSNSGVHSSWYNISAAKRDTFPKWTEGIPEPFGNGNREFPWGDPAGTEKVTNLYKFGFLHLPPRESNGLWPVVYFVDSGYRWVFPKSAIVGEVLCLYSKEGKALPFELRTRTRTLSGWEADAYRPFASAATLRPVAEELGLSALVKQLATPSSDLPTLSYKARHPRPSVSVTSKVDILPVIPASAVYTLLQREFVSVNGQDWKEGCAAPTTAEEFSIVPAGYRGSSFRVPDGCVNCHTDTNQEVDKFESFTDTRRDWYGRIRGSDGIFSLHPFDKSCISHNGFAKQVVINQDLVRKGVFAAFSKEIHPRTVYRQLPGLR